MAGRTPSGHPTAAMRKKHGFKDGSFPVFDEKSARAALKLMKGRATPAQQAAIRKKAAKYGVHTE